MQIRQTLQPFIHVMRLNAPIGILLLLWPTLWALWLAGDGNPESKIVCIFIAGVCLMRSAGCIINDIFDRHMDKHVSRTQERPIASGKLKVSVALLLFVVLLSIAFCLVLLCNPLTMQLAWLGLAFTIIYPLLKRITHLPQLGLGFAFSWGVPMAFAAQKNAVPLSAWLLFSACLLWPIIYDTMYAMADRNDDIKIGVKSTAIWFASYDTFIIGILQIIFLIAMIIVGYVFLLHPVYYIGLLIASGFFLYQQWLIKERDPDRCFRAFLNNQWVGAVIFIGIYASYINKW